MRNESDLFIDCTSGSAYGLACSKSKKKSKPETDLRFDYDYEHEHEFFIRASSFPFSCPQISNLSPITFTDHAAPCVLCSLSAVRTDSPWRAPCSQLLIETRPPRSSGNRGARRRCLILKLDCFNQSSSGLRFDRGARCLAAGMRAPSRGTPVRLGPTSPFSPSRRHLALSSLPMPRRSPWLAVALAEAAGRVGGCPLPRCC